MRCRFRYHPSLGRATRLTRLVAGKADACAARDSIPIAGQLPVERGGTGRLIVEWDEPCLWRATGKFRKDEPDGSGRKRAMDRRGALRFRLQGAGLQVLRDALPGALSRRPVGDDSSPRRRGRPTTASGWLAVCSHSG